MPNQNKSIAKNYDAGDMHDLALMAECDMDWMLTALMDVKHKTAKLKKDLSVLVPSVEYSFMHLEKILEMYEYLADDRYNYHAKQAETFQKEWEQLKGGNHNA